MLVQTVSIAGTVGDVPCLPKIAQAPHKASLSGCSCFSAANRAMIASAMHELQTPACQTTGTAAVSGTGSWVTAVKLAPLRLSIAQPRSLPRLAGLGLPITRRGGAVEGRK
jgi:hypothetical protein